jgi:methyl-accepting chemotaxis protein
LKILVVLFAVTIGMGLLSCKNTQTYGKFAKELDSLSIVVQQAADNFKSIDSTSSMEAYIKYKIYGEFITIHLKDTVIKTDAEKLQQFFASGKEIETFVKLRTDLMNHASLTVKQLKNLSNDLKNGSVNSEEAVDFISKEKQNAVLTIEELKVNTEMTRKHLTSFAGSLMPAENIIKAINQGNLPILPKPIQ